MTTTDQPELRLRVAKLSRDWIDLVFDAACHAAQHLGEFTTDDLHLALNTAPKHPNWWGSLTAKMQAAGVIVEAGRVRSRRPEANGRKVTLWRAVT